MLQKSGICQQTLLTAYNYIDKTTKIGLIMSDSQIHIELKLLLDKLENGKLTTITLKDKPPEFVQLILSIINNGIKSNSFSLTELEFEADKIPEELLLDLLKNICERKSSLKSLKVINLNDVLNNVIIYNNFIKLLRNNINLDSLTITSSVTLPKSLDILQTPKLKNINIIIDDRGYENEKYALGEIYNAVIKTGLKKLNISLDGSFPLDHINMLEYRLKRIGSKSKKDFNLTTSNKSMSKSSIKEQHKVVKKNIEDSFDFSKGPSCDYNKSNISFRNLFSSSSSSSSLSSNTDINHKTQIITSDTIDESSLQHRNLNSYDSFKNSTQHINTISFLNNKDDNELKNKFLEDFLKLYCQKYIEIIEVDDLPYEQDKLININKIMSENVKSAFNSLGYGLDNKDLNDNILCSLRNSHSDFFTFKPQDFDNANFAKNINKFKQAIKSNFRSIIKTIPVNIKSGRLI